MILKYLKQTPMFLFSEGPSQIFERKTYSILKYCYFQMAKKKLEGSINLQFEVYCMGPVT